VSILTALAVALLARLLDRVGQWPLAVVLGASAVLLGAGAFLGLALYPWTDLPVVGFALAGGVLVGRRLPPRSMPMFALLAVLAVLDTIQIVVLGSGSGDTGGATPAWYFYGMLVIDTPWFGTAVGIGDVLLIASIVEHSRRRGLSFAVGAAPGVLAFIAADVLVQVIGPLNLPLVPFLLFGWLASTLAVWIANRSGPSEHPPAA
jgi:hypothetical protein